MKSLLFFSNPFGYGPTATMMAVLRHFLKLTDVKICVVARGLCREIVGSYKNLEIRDIDQRDIPEITNIALVSGNQYKLTDTSGNEYTVTRVPAYETNASTGMIDTSKPLNNVFKFDNIELLAHPLFPRKA